MKKIMFTKDDAEELLEQVSSEFKKCLNTEPHKSARLYELSGTMRNLVDIIRKMER